MKHNLVIQFDTREDLLDFIQKIQTDVRLGAAKVDSLLWKQLQTRNTFFLRSREAPGNAIAFLEKENE